MPRSKHTPEFRARVSQDYIDGTGSNQFLANKYGIGYSTLVGWIHEYRIHGITAFCHKKNRTYSKEFKIKCVEAVINDFFSFFYRSLSPCLCHIDLLFWIVILKFSIGIIHLNPLS